MRFLLFFILLGCVGCSPKYYELSKNLVRDADGTREVYFFKIRCPGKSISGYFNYYKLTDEFKLCMEDE